MKEQNRTTEGRELVKGLMSRFLGERIHAQERLKAMGPGAVDALLAVIDAEQRKLRIRRRIYYGIVGSFVLIGLPLAAWIVYRGMMVGNSEAMGKALGGALGGIIGGWGGGLVGGTIALMFPSQFQIAASAALAQVDDPRAVGPLLEAVVSKMNPSVDSRVSAAMALLRMLPNLGAEEYELLTAHQRNCIHRLLREPHVSKETDLVLAALDTIRRVGDTRALPAVTRLAESSAGDALSLAKCHNVAHDCRDHLLSLQQSVSAAESLVRPSQPPGEESTILLRPTPTTETPANLLLRAPGDERPA